MGYLLRLLSATDASASLKHAAFAVVVVAGVVWLSWSLHREGLTANWSWAFGALLTAVTGAKVLSRQAGPTGTDGVTNA